MFLQESPSIRFRASKPVGDDPGSGLETQALVSQRVALELDERLRQFQAAGQIPNSQTCDLIIVDRSARRALSTCMLALRWCYAAGQWQSCTDAATALMAAVCMCLWQGRSWRRDWLECLEQE